MDLPILALVFHFNKIIFHSLLGLKNRNTVKIDIQHLETNSALQYTYKYKDRNIKGSKPSTT